MPLPAKVRPAFARRAQAPVTAICIAALAIGTCAVHRVSGQPIRVLHDPPFSPNLPSPDKAPRVIFFPPNPPPLGTLIRVTARHEQARDTPILMSAYVAELFYPPLSSRMYRGPLMNSRHMRKISGKHRDLLAEFDQLRLQLVTELRATLLASHNESQQARQSKLESLALKQDQSLRQLERISETLCLELGRSGNWYSLRTWKLGRGKLDRARDENAVLEFQVVRAAAFYQPGLGPQQRRLLRELAIDREQSVLADRLAPPLDERLIFFQPETARFLLPDDLPDDLAAKINELIALKDSLKEELADALYQLDGVWLASQREDGLEELSARQQARLNDLESRAEIIRQGLIKLPAVMQHWIPMEPLAPALQAKVERLLLPPPVWEKDAETDPQFDPEVLAEQILLELESLPDANLMPLMNEPLRAFLVRRERATANYFYANALFQPGMSPGQRRLLFNDAIRNLHLILPGPDFQATEVPETLLY